MRAAPARVAEATAERRKRARLGASMFRVVFSTKDQMDRWNATTAACRKQITSEADGWAMTQPALGEFATSRFAANSELRWGMGNVRKRRFSGSVKSEDGRTPFIGFQFRLQNKLQKAKSHIPPLAADTRVSLSIISQWALINDAQPHQRRQRAP